MVAMGRRIGKLFLLDVRGHDDKKKTIYYDSNKEKQVPQGKQNKSDCAGELTTSRSTGN